MKHRKLMQGLRLGLRTGLLAMLVVSTLSAQESTQWKSNHSNPFPKEFTAIRTPETDAKKLKDPHVASQLAKAEELRQKGEIRGALKGYFQALTHFEKQNDQDRQTGVLLDIGELYEGWEMPERAVDYYHRALVKINSHKVKDFNTNALSLKLAQCYQKMERFDKAEFYFSTLLDQYRTVQNKTAYKLVLSSLSDLYRQENKSAKLLEANLELAEIEKESGDPHQLSIAYINLGFIYRSQNEMDKALNYFSLAYETEKNTGVPDTRALISININRAAVQNQKGKFQEANLDLMAAVRIAEAGNDLAQQADLRNLIALVHYNTRDYQKAYHNCELAVKLGRKSGNREVLVRNYKTFSSILQKLGDFEEALEYQHLCDDLKDSLFYDERQKTQQTLLNRINVERTEKELKLLLTDAEKSEIEYQKLSLEAEKQKQDLELITKENELKEFTYKTEALEKERALQAYQLQTQKLATEKKLEAMALQKKNAEFQAALAQQFFDRKSKQHQILLLKQDKKLLEKNRKLQMSKLESQNARERLFKALVILGSMALVGVIFGLIQIRSSNNSLLQKQVEVEKVNNQLEELNRLVNNKNKSITDSINYARGIQESVLPDRKVWAEAFPNSFIFNKPKDIVSGDFYFLTKARNKWFLAVADCTGHGVPGAFMSLIGSNLLTSIIEIQGVSDPGEILQRLDHLINRTLKAQSPESRDGMEMAICVFDYEAGQMEFASSLMPLYGFGDQGFFEIKGNRFSIGGDIAHPNKLFQKHLIDLKKTSVIYLCSDGYQDQLGGSDNRRFSSKRLKQLLQGIQHKPVEVQHKLIQFTMEEWLNGQKQLDDLMVVGIQLPVHDQVG